MADIERHGLPVDHYHLIPECYRLTGVRYQCATEQSIKPQVVPSYHLYQHYVVEHTISTFS